MAIDPEAVVRRCAYAVYCGARSRNDPPRTIEEWGDDDPTRTMIRDWNTRGAVAVINELFRIFAEEADDGPGAD